MTVLYFVGCWFLCTLVVGPILGRTLRESRRSLPRC